ncbi:MAG: Hydrolase of specificity RsbQ [Myxococcaceae bacterium]|nr:Hydrolase of specificity RsbQ [Myxococcaceae bacterium]
MFAHGFGCDQTMWRYVAPAFEDRFRIVLFDLVGSGNSDLRAYDYQKYGSLEGYALDVLEILHELELPCVTFVGHSVSSMIGVLAANLEPTSFEKLVLVGPSPRYVDDDQDDYRGGFRPEALEQLLLSLDSNYLGWARAVAPAIMGNPEQPELGDALTNSFCRTDPAIGRHFARVTFTSDNRQDLPKVTVPTLILQCSDDIIAPERVGRYVHRAVPRSDFVLMKATGHCPNLSAPDETTAAISAYVSHEQ